MHKPLTLIFLMCVALWGCDTDSGDWQSAVESDTQAAYATYLDAHPEGQHVADASARIASMAAADAWRAATDADTLDSYRVYVDRFGDTAEAITARERIVTLERAAEWLRVRAAGSQAALAAFADRHGGTDEAKEARAVLETIAAEQRRAKADEAERAAREAAARAGRRIQLASFWTLESASKESRRLMGLLGELLPTPLVVQAPAEYGSDRYYRVVTEPIDAETAQRACEHLRSGGRECFTVAP